MKVAKRWAGLARCMTWGMQHKKNDMYPSKQVNEQLFYENKQAIAFPTSPETTDFIRF